MKVLKVEMPDVGSKLLLKENLGVVSSFPVVCHSAKGVYYGEIVIKLNFNLNF